VEDPESMANIVGVKETQSLVDYKLKQVQATRETAAAKAKDAKELSAQRYREMQDVERKAAELHAQERHLKEKVVIDRDTADEKEAVAAKADAIAKKMEALAQAADAEEQKAKSQEQASSQQLRLISASAQEADAERTKAEARRRLAEKAASSASAELATVDGKEKHLLQRHAKLERMAAEEDNRQTTRLAEAFQEDARRQAQFRASIVQQRQAELAQKQHQQLTHAEHQRQMAQKAADYKQVAGARQEQQVQSLTALERALLRKNPELAKYRTMAREQQQGAGSGMQRLSSSLGSIRRDYQDARRHSDSNSRIREEFQRLSRGGAYVRDDRSPRRYSIGQASLGSQFKQFSQDQGLGSVMLAQRDGSIMWRRPTMLADNTWALDHPGMKEQQNDWNNWGQHKWAKWRQNAMSTGGFTVPTPGEPREMPESGETMSERSSTILNSEPNMWKNQGAPNTWDQEPGLATGQGDDVSKWGKEQWAKWRQNAMSTGGFTVPTPGEPAGKVQSWQNSATARNTEKQREERSDKFLEDADFEVPASDVPRI